MKALEVIRLCKGMGVELLVTGTYRTIQEQARLYRKSRTRAEIDEKIAYYGRRDMPFLADVLAGVGPQLGTIGNHKTNAGPAESWHQLREALDVVPLVDGKCEWDKMAEEWQVYGHACRQVGLSWAGDWRRFREYPHAQLHEASNPLNVLTPDRLRERLGL